MKFAWLCHNAYGVSFWLSWAMRSQALFCGKSWGSNNEKGLKHEALDETVDALYSCRFHTKGIGECT